MTDLLMRLSHVCIATPDLDRLLAFYVELLGCRVIHTFRRSDGTEYGVFLQVGGGTFLEVFKGSFEPCGNPSIRHFCFQVEDIQAVASVLRTRGLPAEVRRGKTDRVWLIETLDPDGRTVEFHQYDTESVQFPYL